MIMTFKYLFMKLVGLLTVTIGLAYSITSFYNLFDVIFGNKLIAENHSLFVMGIGVIFPLFVFIFGVFFYLYADWHIEKKSLWILVCIIIMLILGVLKVLLSFEILKGIPFSYFLNFVHISFGYIAIVLSLFLAYGRLKYKY